MAMQIDVNLAACEGHGLCAQVAPQVYEIDDEGYVRVRAAVITTDLEGAATAGAGVCPVAALKIVPPSAENPSKDNLEHIND